MKRRTNLMLRCAVLCFGATLFAPFASAQTSGQQVKINGTAVCSGDVSMQVDPSGNLNFPSCTPSGTGGGGAPSAPFCSNVTLTVNADAVATPTIASNCNTGGATIDAYAWSAVTTGAPFPSVAPTVASFAGGPFPTAGQSYVYNVMAHNSVGLSNLATVTVSVVTPGACGTNQAAATWSLFTASQLATVPQNSYYSIKLPIFGTAGRSEIFNAVNSSNPGISPLPTEFTISSCPGDFTNFVPNCKVYGQPDNAAISMTARTYLPSATILGGCGLRTGTQYYLNVRNVDSSNVNSCPVGQCSLIVQLHGS